MGKDLRVSATYGDNRSTDPMEITKTYTLGGTDGESFDIDATTGQLKL